MQASLANRWKIFGNFPDLIYSEGLIERGLNRAFTVLLKFVDIFISHPRFENEESMKNFYQVWKISNKYEKFLTSMDKFRTKYGKVQTSTEILNKYEIL